MEILYQNLLAFDRYDLIMIAIGCLLVYLAIVKEMEPSLLLPMGFGTILVNIPFSDALVGPIRELYDAGVAKSVVATAAKPVIAVSKDLVNAYNVYLTLNVGDIVTFNGVDLMGRIGVHPDDFSQQRTAAHIHFK